MADLQRHPPRAVERIIRHFCKSSMGIRTNRKRRGKMSFWLYAKENGRSEYRYNTTINGPYTIIAYQRIIFVQITDDGLNVTEYMVQIRYLRFNYTSFDERYANSSEMKKMMFDVIKESAIIFSDKKCFYNNYSPDNREHCYELIQSYERAANRCKLIKNSEGKR